MPDPTLESRFERWRARGDGAALSDVFDALAPGLLRLAIHLVGDPAAAEDLVQQTFVTAIERAASWDARRPLEPWLQGILSNHARDLRRSARRRHDPHFDLESVLAREEESPLESASRRELSGELARAVDALDEPYRAAVLLRLRHGMEAADIAHVLGRSPGVVRVQLHRAREMLRKALPAGIASALVMLAEPARGLECARNQVLEHAARLAPAAGVGGGMLGGAIVMKKLVAAALVLLIGLAAYIAWPLGDPVDPTRTEPAATADVLDAPAAAIAGPLEPAAERARTAEVAAVAPVEAKEVLRGLVLDANTDMPVAGARIALYAPKSLTVSELRSRYWDRLEPSDWGTRQFGPWPYFDEDLTPAQEVGLEPLLVRAPPEPGERAFTETTSGPDGRFELSAVSTDGLLTCDATGYARRSFATRGDRHGVDPATERTIYLATNRSMRGRIVDEKGEPIQAAITLSFYGHAPKSLRKQGDPPKDPQDRRVTFHTDGEGRFDAEVDAHLGFVRSLDARWRVVEHGRLEADGVKMRHRPRVDLVDEVGEIRIVLAPLCSILVRDAETHAPIEDAFVGVRMSASFRPARYGWFHLEGGRLQLTPVSSAWGRDPDVSMYRAESVCRVWKPGYALASVTIPDLMAPGVFEIDLVRDASPPVSGRVHRGAAAVVGARVLAIEATEGNRARTEGTIPHAGVVTDADGRFEFALPNGRYVLVVDPDELHVRRGLDVPAPGFVDIDLDASATLLVRVADAAGKPEVSRDVRVLDTHWIETRGTTDGRGTARFEELPAGATEVRVSYAPPSSGFSTDDSTTIELLAGATNEVAFTAPDGGPRFARLVVEDGPVEGWTARRSPWSGGGGEVASDGRIPIDFSDDRTFVLGSPSGTQWWIRMPKDAPDGAEVRVRSGGRGYRGRLLDARTGEPLKGMVLLLTAPNASGLPGCIVPLDADGRFEIRGLADAEWSIRAVDRSGSAEPVGGDVSFEPTAMPADPPFELVLRQPRIESGAFEGYPTVTLDGGFGSDARAAFGCMAYLSVKIPSDGCTIWLSQSARVGSNGRFRMRVPVAAEWSFSLWGGESLEKLAAEKWRPSGADPEVREFKLLP